MDQADKDLRDRVIARMHELPLKDAGLFLIDVTQALLDKTTTYSPIGSRMMKLGTEDGKLTIAFAKDEVAPMLAMAYEALKSHLMK